jgi:hypothetical protein
LLGGLTKKTKRAADKKKKRKLHEFSMPILSIDVKKSRKDMADVAAASKQKVDSVIKFAGKEYSVSTKAGAAKSDKKGLDKVLESMDEPKKVSTMEKSSLDWDKFKEKEGIEEELTQYTKDGCVHVLLATVGCFVLTGLLGSLQIHREAGVLAAPGSQALRDRKGRARQAAQTAATGQVSSTNRATKPIAKLLSSSAIPSRRAV